MSLIDRKINYLIFVPKNPQVKDELSSMYQRERKVILHEFSIYKEGKRVTDSFHLAFLKQIFDHRSEEYYDWCFATNPQKVLNKDCGRTATLSFSPNKDSDCCLKS